MDTDAFAKLFTCISSSIQAASDAIGERGGQPGTINLEKNAAGVVKKVEAVERQKLGKKRQVFISGVCQSNKKPYLLRYKLDNAIERYRCIAAHKLEKDFSQEEAGAIETVSSNELQGIAPCPHCGNHGHGYCACGTMVCIDVTNPVKINDVMAVKMLCPVCGKTGYMAGSGEGFDINQSAG